MVSVRLEAPGTRKSNIFLMSLLPLQILAVMATVVVVAFPAAVVVVAAVVAVAEEERAAMH